VPRNRVDVVQCLPANCSLSLVRPIKTSFAVITFLVTLSATAHAAVAETVKQVEARYGKPERVLYERGGVRKLGYRYRGLLVIECYVAGVSKSEFFDRPDDLEAPARPGRRSNLDPQPPQSRRAS